MKMRPVAPPEFLSRPDDPRLGEGTSFTLASTIVPGTPVLLGFPHEEGVRRNGGRPGACEAPDSIRHWLYRMVALDLRLVDLGNVVTGDDLEADQLALGEVVRDLLGMGAVPVVLGGGHETAFGVYLGYALTGREVGIINLDAHLDVRPMIHGKGHSGSPFRQAMEYQTGLPGTNYACLGAQPFSVSRDHVHYVRSRGGIVAWRDEVAGRLVERFSQMTSRYSDVHLSIDADVVTAADVPGVSAPNPAGLSGVEVGSCAWAAGATRNVRSLELVEINPRHDLDSRSARWGAMVIWQFLSGLATRPAALSL